MRLGVYGKIVIAVAAIFFLTFAHQNCDSAYLDPKTKKRDLASDSSDGLTGGTTGGVTGTTTGETTGTNGGTTGFDIPASDEEETVIDCGAWVCPPYGDYSCAPGFSDEEWRQVFMEMIENSGAGQVATMEALEMIEVPMRAIGVVFARNSAGILRGRIYLPAFQQCGRWERAFDVITGWGGQWTWVPRGNLHW